MEGQPPRVCGCRCASMAVSADSVTMAMGRFVVDRRLSLVSAVRKGLPGPRPWDAEKTADGI